MKHNIFIAIGIVLCVFIVFLKYLSISSVDDALKLWDKKLEKYDKNGNNKNVKDEKKVLKKRKNNS